MLFPLIARLGRMREEDITTNAACIWVSNRYGLRTLGHGNKLIRIELHGKLLELTLAVMLQLPESKVVLYDTLQSLAKEPASTSGQPEQHEATIELSLWLHKWDA